MKFDLASDVHEDHWKRRENFNWLDAKNEGSSILVLAGDIGNHLIDLYSVLNITTKIYDHVIFVDGNHEHYFSNVSVKAYLKNVKKDLMRLYNNVTLLCGDNEYKIGNTVFLGANGWYDWEIMKPDFTKEECKHSWRNCMNDSVYIDFGSKLSADNWAKVNSKDIAEKVTFYQEDSAIDNIVIVTHSAPLRQLLIDKPGNDSWNKLSGSFGNDSMKNVLNIDNAGKIKVWCYGHTHQRNDLLVDNVRFVNNARAYPGEIAEIWSLKQIEV